MVNALRLLVMMAAAAESSTTATTQIGQCFRWNRNVVPPGSQPAGGLEFTSQEYRQRQQE